MQLRSLEITNLENFLRVPLGNSNSLHETQMTMKAYIRYNTRFSYGLCKYESTGEVGILRITLSQETSHHPISWLLRRGPNETRGVPPTQPGSLLPRELVNDCLLFIKGSLPKGWDEALPWTSSSCKNNLEYDARQRTKTHIMYVCSENSYWNT